MAGEHPLVRIHRDNPWLLVVLLLLIATALGSMRFNDDLFWSDEELTVFMSAGGQHGPASVLDIFIRIGDNAWPPLHNMLLIPWSWAFGWSEFSTRLMALLIGVLAISVVYRAGRDFFGQAVGLVAAVLMTTTAFYLHYLHEGRGYTLYVLLTITTVWLSWKLLNTPRQRPWGVAIFFVLSGTAMLYVHYIAAATWLALLVYHMVFEDRTEDRWQWVMRSMVGMVLLYLPWMGLGLGALLGESGIDRGLDTLSVIERTFYGFGNGMWPYLVLMGIYAAAFVRTRAVILLAVVLGVAYPLALIVNILTDYLFNIRHIFLVLPLLLLLVAAAIVDIAQRRSVWVAGGLVVLWVAMGLWHYANPDVMNDSMEQVPYMPRESTLAAIETLEACSAVGDAAVFYMLDTTYEPENARVVDYYVQHLPMRYAQIATMADISNSVAPAVDYADRVTSLTADAAQVWYFEAPGMDSIEESRTFAELVNADAAQCQALTSGSGLAGFVWASDANWSCEVPGVSFAPCE